MSPFIGWYIVHAVAATCRKLLKVYISTIIYFMESTRQQVRAHRCALFLYITLQVQLCSWTCKLPYKNKARNWIFYTQNHTLRICGNIAAIWISQYEMKDPRYIVSCCRYWVCHTFMYTKTSIPGSQKALPCELPVTLGSYYGDFILISVQVTIHTAAMIEKDRQCYRNFCIFFIFLYHLHIIHHMYYKMKT